MTTATTVLALLPLALGAGEAARLRSPLALTIIGGIIASTIGSPAGDPVPLPAAGPTAAASRKAVE